MEPDSLGVKNWLTLVKAWAQTLKAPCVVSGVTPPVGQETGCAGDVLAAGVEIELRIGGVLEEVGVQADPVVIDAGVNVVCGDDGAEGKFTLYASGDLQGVRSATRRGQAAGRPDAE